MENPRRGEVWWAKLGKGQGHEQEGTRPSLIVSNDKFNDEHDGLVAVAPLTCSGRRNRIRFRPRLDPPEGGVRDQSFIQCDQIRSIDRPRLEQRLGRIEPETLEQVVVRMAIVLDLVGAPLPEFYPDPACPFRGEVWDANLDPAQGSEIGGSCAVLAVSHDFFNQIRGELVIAAPITDLSYNVPYRIRIDPPQGAVQMPSFIQVGLLRAISKDRLIKRSGSVGPKVMKEVARLIKTFLAIRQ